MPHQTSGLLPERVVLLTSRRGAFEFWGTSPSQSSSRDIVGQPMSSQSSGLNMSQVMAIAMGRGKFIVVILYVCPYRGLMGQPTVCLLVPY